jgi:hypothetical protein
MCEGQREMQKLTLIVVREERSQVATWIPRVADKKNYMEIQKLNKSKNSSLKTLVWTIQQLLGGRIGNKLSLVHSHLMLSHCDMKIYVAS